MVNTKTATPSQHFVPIDEIRDNVVILKNGQICGVLLTTSINLALKSTGEQQSILASFQSFLNSLDFPIQIYLQSRKMDIRPYLTYLKSLEGSQYNDLMRTQLREYTEFIRTFTQDVDIMKKNFFVVIPYTPPIISKGGGFLRKDGGSGDSGLSEQQFSEYMTQLNQRIYTVAEGLEGLGVKSARLNKDALTELYYHLFNPNEKGNAPRAA